MLIILLSFFFVRQDYSADIVLNATYGINNNARSGRLLPLEINITNRENVEFTGALVVNVYESNDVIFRYNYDLVISANNAYQKNTYISINEKSNTILVEVYDDADNIVDSQMLNIDLYSLGNKMIIGLISDNVAKLTYFNDLALNNGNIRTTTVNITNENYEKNRNILEQVDLLVISGIDTKSIGSALNSSLIKFLNDGKVILLGTGDNAGYNIPIPFLKYQIGPSFNDEQEIDLNGRLTNNAKIYDATHLITTVYNFENNISIIDDNKDSSIISNLMIGSGILSNAIFDFCDIAELMNDDNTFIVRLIETVMGQSRLSIIENNNQLLNENNYTKISEVLSVSELTNYPNVVVIALLLFLYLLFIIVVLYASLRLVKKLKYYAIFVIVFSLFFIFILSFEAKKTIKNDLSLNYQSIIELFNGSSKEQAFIDVMAYNRKNYTLRTSANNNIYPVMKNNNNPIRISNVLVNSIVKSDDAKYIDFYNDANEYVAEVSNAKPFDRSLYIYENNNDLNNSYIIDIAVNFFDGKLTGRVTNKMDKTIYDSSIIFLGKTVYIGDIEPNSSKTLSAITPFNSPIGNNTMQSALMCYYPRTKIIKYYLDNNVYQNIHNAKFFGFIDGNNTMSLIIDEIDEIEASTLIIKNVDVDYRNDNEFDMCSFDYNVVNLKGKYYSDNNSIDGNQDIVNEYYFDNKMILKKVYFENLTYYDYDVERRNEEFNIPFFGSIRVKNLYTNQFDYILLNELNRIELRNYIDDKNKITIMFSPSGKDVIDRKMSLPIIRAVGEY